MFSTPLVPFKYVFKVSMQSFDRFYLKTPKLSSFILTKIWWMGKRLRIIKDSRWCSSRQINFMKCNRQTTKLDSICFTEKNPPNATHTRIWNICYVPRALNDFALYCILTISFYFLCISIWQQAALSPLVCVRRLDAREKYHSVHLFIYLLPLLKYRRWIEARARN